MHSGLKDLSNLMKLITKNYIFFKDDEDDSSTKKNLIIIQRSIRY